MPIPITHNIISESVVKAISNIIEKEKEEIIKQAIEKFENSIRKSIATVAIAAHDYYTIEPVGNVLRIDVKIHPEKK